MTDRSDFDATPATGVEFGQAEPQRPQLRPHPPVENRGASYPHHVVDFPWPIVIMAVPSLHVPSMPSHLNARRSDRSRRNRLPRRTMCGNDSTRDYNDYSEHRTEYGRLGKIDSIRLLVQADKTPRTGYAEKRCWAL